jgi:hypothetical protein
MGNWRRCSDTFFVSLDRLDSGCEQWLTERIGERVMPDNSIDVCEHEIELSLSKKNTFFRFFLFVRSLSFRYFLF